MGQEESEIEQRFPSKCIQVLLILGGSPVANKLNNLSLKIISPDFSFSHSGRNLQIPGMLLSMLLFLVLQVILLLHGHTSTGSVTYSFLETLDQLTHRVPACQPFCSLVSLPATLNYILHIRLGHCIFLKTFKNG